MIIQSVSQISSISRSKYLILLDILLDNLVYYARTKRQIVEVFVIKHVLVITYFIAAHLLRSIYKTKVTFLKELSGVQQGRYMIVANHKKAIDPYLILATLPFSTFSNLLPVRFFTANIFLKSWWQRLLLMPYGCFRAYSTEGKISGVKGGLYLSDKGQTLFIFPEGKRIKSSEKRELKIGVAYLAQQREFTILPVYINYSKKSIFGATRIIWGKPFEINQNTRNQSLEQLTKHIFDKVLALSA